ncbi:Glycoside hydrolase, superfamily [Pseudocohnilembus persalinus]|uniref:Glycoside hydrolase, superfamily n=1 Tax=Pseudocohnilembus persalinus TaxID=266149 RepID=A0A0V0QT81_PSEPJ|nr:Glycoside hydrolase, superfamily [Pseudocohnilembus persalinus]|eukprot:KRX05587.1 Glycoside hydrolase, superfamily [Pseudocohnilembus persalinus]
MTSFINEDSSNFQEGLKNNYFMNNGTILKWWHGKGALLDYSNPDALNWWNNQLNNVLDIGIDGFKTDGSDPYLYMLLPQPIGHIGEIDHRQYANYYYNETFNQVRKVRGLDGLIMARPMALLVPGEYSYWLYLRYSPNDIVFSGWMGDQKGTFDGIKVALRMMFHSSVYNATNFGSDIGGYLNDHDYPQGRSKEVFIRWAQLGALNPLMENGGGGNHEPWAWDGETVEIYKKFVNIHYELFPFFYASGSQAFEKQKSVMQPVAQIQDKLADFSFPSSYDFTLWNSIHVSPIIKNKTVTTVQFPQGQTEWRINNSYEYNH